MRPSENSGDTRSNHDPRPPAFEHDAGLGDLLKAARERRGLTIQEVSNTTKIPQRHLEALEQGDLAAVPGGFYRRAQVRAYARAVRLDEGLALSQLERASNPQAAVAVPPESSRPPAPLLSGKRVAIGIGVVVVGLAVLGRAMAGRDPLLERDQARRVDAPREQGAASVSVSKVPSDAVSATSTHIDTSHEVALVGASTVAEALAASSDNPAGPAEAERPAPAAADPTNQLVVTTQPTGGRVTVNGIGWGVAPVTIRYLPAGDKLVRVTKEGYAPEERIVHIADGRANTLAVQLRAAR